MRGLLFVLLLAAQGAAGAQFYKCTGADGKVAFMDRPCEGAATRQEAVAVTPPPQNKWERTTDDNWEETMRFRFVEVPALERQAAELIDSGDPEKVAIGKEMAWKAHQAKEAFERLEKVRQNRAEIKARYDRLRY